VSLKIAVKNVSTSLVWHRVVVGQWKGEMNIEQACILSSSRWKLVAVVYV